MLKANRRKVVPKKKVEELKAITMNVRIQPEVREGLKRLRDEAGVSASKIAEIAWRDAVNRWDQGLPPIVKSGVPAPVIPARVQLCGKVCAGEGITVEPLDDLWVEVPEGIRSTPARYALRIEGASMDGLAGHSIVDGMIAFFDKEKPAYPNCVAHIEWDDNGTQVCTVKKLKYREGQDKVILKPTNPRYEAREVFFSDIEVKGVLITAVPGEDAKILDRP